MTASASQEHARSNIKTCVASISSCTPATVQAVRLLLNGSESKTVGNCRHKSGPSVGLKKPSVKDSATQQNVEVSRNNRTYMAEEVVNGALQALCEARMVGSGRFQQNDAPSGEKTTSAIRELSLNRAPHAGTSAKRRGKSASKPAKSSSPPHDGVAAISECAYIAFRFLHNTRIQQAGQFQISDWNIENGMLALLGKLISLQRVDLATPGLCLLKQILDSRAEPQQSAHLVPCGQAPGTSGRESLRLDHLLGFDTQGVQSSALHIIASFQLLVLRSRAVTSQRESLDCLRQQLDPQCEHSPLKIIWQIAETSGDMENAASQMERLSQTILQIATRLDSVEPKNNAKCENLASRVWLQAFALRCRLSWMLAAKHNGDRDKEVIQPFVKCLTDSYSKMSSVSASEYEILKSSVELLQAGLHGSKSNDFSARLPKNEAFKKLYALMREIAVRAGIDSGNAYSEFCSGTSSNGHGLSSAAQCSSACHISTRKFKQMSAANETFNPEVIVRVLDLIQKGLDGTFQEIDSMLSDVLLLRNVTTHWVQSNLDIKDPKNSLSIVETIQKFRDLAASAISLMIQFSPIGEQNHSRNKLISNATVNSIECFLWYLSIFQKLEIKDNYFKVKLVLDDCVDVLQMSHPNFAEAWSDIKVAPLLMRLSHAYLGIYNQVKSDCSNTAIHVLQRSCDLLDGAPSSEMIKGGLPMKLDRLANLCYHHNELEKANVILLKLIDTLCGLEVLSEATLEPSATIHVIFNHNEQTRLLGNAFRLLLDIQGHFRTESREYCSFWDNDSLEPLHRGIILEWELHIISGWTASKKLSPFVTEVASGLGLTLFNIYETSKFRLQRMRLTLKVLHLEIDTPNSFSTLVLELAEEYANNCITSVDVIHCDCLNHLQASLEMVVALRDPSFRSELFEKALGRWSSLLENIHGWGDLYYVIGDVQSWFKHLEYALDLLEARGSSSVRLAVSKFILRIRQLEQDRNSEGLFLAHINLGLQLLRLGYSEICGILLAKATDLESENNRCVESRMEYHIAYAEYFLDLGEHLKSYEHLRLAQQLSIESPVSAHRRPFSLNKKVLDYLRDSDILHVDSHLHAASGNFALAVSKGADEFYLLHSVWKSLENHNKGRSPEQLAQSADNAQALADSFAALSFSVHNSSQGITSAPTIQGPRFWPLLPRLCRSATHMSRLCYQGGSMQDAFYFLDQAQKVAEFARADKILATLLTCRGNLECRKGDLTNGWKSLCYAQELLHHSDQTQEAISLHQCLGYFYHLKKEWDLEIKEYDAAWKILSNLVQVDHRKDLDHDARNHQLKTSNHSKVATVGRSRQTSKTKPAAVLSESASAIIPSPPKKDCCLLNVVERQLHRLKISCMLQKGNLLDTSKTLSDLEGGIVSKELNLDHRILKARLLLREAGEILSTNAIFGMLAESAIALSAIVPPSKSCSTKPSKLHGENYRIEQEEPPNSPLTVLHTFGRLLHQAIQVLAPKAKDQDNSSTLIALRKKVSSLGTASFLLSAVRHTLHEMHINPLGVLQYADLPQYSSCLRDLAITQIDRISKEKFEKTKLTTKPPTESFEADRDYLRFYQEFSSSLPTSWNVFSMSLDDEQQHLHIVRHRANSKLFALRLPLDRQNSDEQDEEGFSFEEARSELAQIIERSDATVHAARIEAQILKKKGARSEWWAEREALDNRMQSLILNIQNMWLGGFRGIFSKPCDIPELVLRFQKSFEIVLEKYLPSRQTSHKRFKTPKVKLDQQVLDLFLGLVRSNEDPYDLDEELTDLLYFVVDALQFNGEANAYDEVDFDSMIIETQDALKSFQESLADIDTKPSTSHTILLLDKQLHSFPWECLPSLDGNSVSRAYSILEIQERVSMMQSQKNQRAHGISVSCTNGSYILNPSQDLDKTEKRFQAELAELCDGGSSWTGIVGRAPTEQEFASALCGPSSPNKRHGGSQQIASEESAGILLYFGHGSGAQYIRHRRIKQMRFEPQDSIEAASLALHEESGDVISPSTALNTRVSVALLFGCSSASLSDNFEFEPHGTPKSYMLAGSPALLGSLWDVTDGDVDKFASGVLERWGLFEKGTFEELRTTSSRARGKGKVRAETTELKAEERNNWLASDLNLSLNEAVAKSRGECYLKYLNGAAMVVYGVPVYLEKDE